jgi:amino acid permease
MNKFPFDNQEKFAIVIGCAIIFVWFCLVVLWLIKMMRQYTWNEKIKNSEQYSSETLNLPPGTLRAILTLSLLITLVVLVCISMFVTQLKGQFDSIVGAFELMIAFYFGSKVMDNVTSNDREKSIQRSEAEIKKAEYNRPNPTISEIPFNEGGSEG